MERLIDNSPVTTGEFRETTNSAVTTANLDISHADMLIRQSRLTNITSGQVQDFLLVPFTQHYTILTKTKALDDRLFYIHLCAREHLTVKALDKERADGCNGRDQVH